MGSPIPGPEALHWEADGADNRKNGAFSSRHETMTSDPAALAAMRLCGRPADDLERALCDRIVNAGPPDNLASTALVLHALTGPRPEHAALAV